MLAYAAGIQDARPRARALAWWAVLASCALHAGVANLWWRERIEPAGVRAPHEPESPFFVDLLPPKAPAQSMTQAPAVQQGSAAQQAPASGSGSVLPQDRQAAPAVAPRQRSGARKAPLPPAPQPDKKGGAAGAAPPQRDFGWRAGDAAAAGMPQARGEPVVRLGPKAPAEQSDIARGIAKSARPPCKNAHADMGLLALPFLLADTVTDRGCKW